MLGLALMPLLGESITRFVLVACCLVSAPPAEPLPHSGPANARRGGGRQLRPASVRLRHRGLHARVEDKDPDAGRQVPHRGSRGRVAVYDPEVSLGRACGLAPL